MCTRRCPPTARRWLPPERGSALRSLRRWGWRRTCARPLRRTAGATRSTAVPNSSAGGSQRRAVGGHRRVHIEAGLRITDHRVAVRSFEIGVELVPPAQDVHLGAVRVEEGKRLTCEWSGHDGSLSEFEGGIAWRCGKHFRSTGSWCPFNWIRNAQTIGSPIGVSPAGSDLDADLVIRTVAPPAVRAIDLRALYWGTRIS